MCVYVRGSLGLYYTLLPSSRYGRRLGADIKATRQKAQLFLSLSLSLYYPIQLLFNYALLLLLGERLFLLTRALSEVISKWELSGLLKIKGMLDADGILIEPMLRSLIKKFIYRLFR